MSEVHEIHTTCGRIFKMTVQEMSDRQLASLIRQNQDSDALPEMEAELARRQLLTTTADNTTTAVERMTSDELLRELEDLAPPEEQVEKEAA
jgi:hypothetical protein